MYEVIGYSMKRDKMVEYDVLFDSCEDPVTVNAKEMMGMLESVPTGLTEDWIEVCFVSLFTVLKR